MSALGSSKVLRNFEMKAKIEIASKVAQERMSEHNGKRLHWQQTLSFWEKLV